MPTDDDSKLSAVEVLNWDALVRYTEFLSQGAAKQIKICMVDDEQEEVRLQSNEEFNLNIQYAREHGLQSIKLIVYMDDKHLFDGIYHIERPAEKNAFPSDKLQILVNNALAEKWYIPVKQDEALGVCLLAAIQLAQGGKLGSNADCRRFIDDILPEALRKIQNSQSVFSWPREIHFGIFEMLELFIDLVGIRLNSPPVPVHLLELLSTIFDVNTTFSQKHRNEPLPTRRTYTLVDDDFLRHDLNNGTYGWLQSLLQRFIAQNGLKNVRLQFEYIDSANSNQAATEYTALLKLFSKCHSCINAHRFRLIFARPIDQAMRYVQSQPMSIELKKLDDTLKEICLNYEIKDEIDQLLALTNNVHVSDTTPVPVSTAAAASTELPLLAERHSKATDCYERLAANVRILNMDAEQKNIKKQRTDEETAAEPLFTRHLINDCIDEMLTTSDKRSLKRKHRRDQQRSSLTSTAHGHHHKKEMKRSNTSSISSDTGYDRSNPEDILRYFAPMKAKVAAMYDALQTAICHGQIREVLKIEEKLKLLRPFAARFIADENTPDGSVMQAGQVFRKGWILLNDGSLPWDSSDIQLINLSDGIRVVRPPVVPVTAPHEKATITVEYMCAHESGSYESKWILAYRQHTFGPMIWCSIQIGQPAHAASRDSVLQSIAKATSFDELRDGFEFVEVPLPECFDLSKPFQSSNAGSMINSLRSSFTLSQIDSIELASERLRKMQVHATTSDSDSASTVSSLLALPSTQGRTYSTQSSVDDPIRFTELVPSAGSASSDDSALGRDPWNGECTLTTDEPSGQRMDFVDTMVTNIFSVAKHATSTAKAIFHTLQATDEPTEPTASSSEEQKPTLINTFNSSQPTDESFFEPIEASATPTSSMDPMKTLIAMGFANRAKNQRLLRENGDDLEKVIEQLTLDVNEDSDWFAHRH